MGLPGRREEQGGPTNWQGMTHRAALRGGNERHSSKTNRHREVLHVAQ